MIPLRELEVQTAGRQIQILFHYQLDVEAQQAQMESLVNAILIMSQPNMELLMLACVFVLIRTQVLITLQSLMHKFTQNVGGQDHQAHRVLLSLQVVQ